MQTRQIRTGNSERQVHNFSEKQIQECLWRIDNQYKVRTVTNRFASSVVSIRRHLVAFKHDQRNWGWFIPGRNVKWNGKFPEFPNSRKKGQPREVDRNFRNESPEIFCSIWFWTRIFGNFGRMERALCFPKSHINENGGNVLTELRDQTSALRMKFGDLLQWKNKFLNKLFVSH